MKYADNPDAAVPEHKLAHNGDKKVNSTRKHLRSQLGVDDVPGVNESPALSPNGGLSRASSDEILVEEVICPDYPAKELHEKLEQVVLEYFNSCDADECIESLLEVDDSSAGRIASIIVAVECAIDHKSEERALVSHLLVGISSHMAEEDIYRALDTLLATVDELKLDNPEAPQILAYFIARAVADDVVHPNFLLTRRNLSNPLSVEVVETAHTLVNMRHGMAKLDNIWGSAGSRRSLVDLMETIKVALHEYAVSSDRAECERQIRELDVPHFHHEVVYESVVLSLEENAVHPQYAERFQNLLNYFAQSAVITEDQIKAGFERVARGVEELVKDIPKADTTFIKFVEDAHAAGYLPKDVKTGVLELIKVN